MSTAPFPSLPRRLWAHDTFVSSLRVFIALAALLALCWLRGEMASLIPLFLGVIACALAETDDSWRGRLRAQIVTLACFAVAAVSVKVLFPHPWLFVLGLAAASFALTMLGALGERYRAIASATLILSIYTMIGVEQGGAGAGFWREPALLLAGAAWYGLLSVLWCAAFAHQPVQQKLARVFRLLGDYLELKASLFEPVRDLDVEARRLALARLNGKVVEALNAAKESIFSRVVLGRPGRKIRRYLALYFVAQDVHERAGSSHYAYQALAEAFFHSDVMFRCQRLVGLEAQACRRLAAAIQLRQRFVLGEATQQASADLDASLANLREQERPQWHGLLRSLGALAANLRSLDRGLARASQPEAIEEPDSTLFDRSPQSARDAIDRVRNQLTPDAPVFRHAVRLAVALAAGYGALHVLHAHQGYWIVLTTLFVCSPSYGATRTRVVQRVAGTVLGLVAGWVLFRLFPDRSVQSLLAVAAGVLFFATRSTRYMIATAAITVLVLLCFNQIGNGFDLFVPRLVDTLAGAGIAALATLVVLPDWQGRRLGQIASQTLQAHARYLRAVMQQYRTGKRDDLDYRLARRNAHNADAALSVAMSNMLSEPAHLRRDADTGLRFLVLSHTLLNYLSALGAHRSALSDGAQAVLAGSVDEIAAELESIAAALTGGAAPPAEAETETGAERLAVHLESAQDALDDPDDMQRLLRTQLALIARLLAPLRRVAARLEPAAPAVLQ